MFKNPLLLIALALTGLVASWGIIDTAGLAKFSSTLTGMMLSLIHISEPTRPAPLSRMPSSA